MDNMYLTTDFDPKSLKVAQLKAVLTSHRIAFPSSAKKADLIHIFTDNIHVMQAQLADPDTAPDVSALSPNVNNPKPAKKPEISPKPTKRRADFDEPDARKKGKLFEDDTDLNDAIAKSLSPKKSASATPTKNKKSPKPDTPKITLEPVELTADAGTAKPAARSAQATPKSTPKARKTPKKSPKGPDTSVGDSSVSEAAVSVKSPKESSVKSPKAEVKSPKLEVKSPKVEAKSPKVKTPKVKSPKVTSPKAKSPRVKSPRSPKAKAPTPKPFKNLEDETEDFDKHFKPAEASPTEQLGPAIDIPANSAANKVFDSENTGKLRANPRKIAFLDSTAEKPTETDSDEEMDSEEPAHNPPKPVDIPVKPNRSLLPIFIYIIVWVLVLFSTVFGYWYRDQTFLIGYCGHEIDEPTFTNEDHPALAFLGGHLDKLKPQCVACPQHARCFGNLQLACYEDFVEFKPWYYDVVPFFSPSSKKCVPDTNKAEKLEMMIDVSLDLLRSKNALENCGANAQDNFDSGLKVSDLYDMLLSIKAPYITVEEFDELWERAIVELQKEPEVIVRQVNSTDFINVFTNL